MGQDGHDRGAKVIASGFADLVKNTFIFMFVIMGLNLAQSTKVPLSGWVQ